MTRPAETRALAPLPDDRDPPAAVGVRVKEDVARLSRMYTRAAEHNALLTAQVKWLSQIVTVLHSRRRWWWWLIPAGLMQTINLRRLRRKSLFDAIGYRNANPDVAEAGADPLRHYVMEGIRERRPSRPGAGSAYERFVPAVEVRGHSQLDGATAARILDSGMFDADWYRARYAPAIVEKAELLHNYLSAIGDDVLRDPGPLFSTIHYLELNPDTAGVHPLLHFIEYGVFDDRRVFSPAKVNAFLADAPLDSLERLTDYLDPARPTVVLRWEDGNFFFTDIADYLAAFLNQKNFPATSSMSDATVALGTANIVVVAPHEYCVHGPGKFWSHDQFADAVYINTEQWHTSWFTLAYNIFRRSGKVLDVNPASAAGFARMGMRAGFFPLLPLAGTAFDFGPAPIADAVRRGKMVKPLTYPALFADRPYDLVFLGVINLRRAAALAVLAPTLAGYDCFLHAPRFDGPLRSDDPDMISSADFAQIAMNARILLNIHQGESHYFEWHRLFLSGIALGCVVVTEPCTPVGVLVEGEHYLTATLAEMPALITHLLSTLEGQSQMQAIHRNCRKIADEIAAGTGLAAW